MLLCTFYKKKYFTYPLFKALIIGVKVNINDQMASGAKFSAIGFNSNVGASHNGLKIQRRWPKVNMMVEILKNMCINS